MSPWEVAGLGVLFIVTIAGSTALVLNMLLPISAPAVGVPTCQTGSIP